MKKAKRITIVGTRERNTPVELSAILTLDDGTTVEMTFDMLKDIYNAIRPIGVERL